MRRWFWSILIVGLSLIGCRNFDEPPINEPSLEATNISILTLRNAVKDKPLHIKENLTIGGYVTTDDSSGNFYKTFCIEDGTAGIEVMAGLYDLHRIYPMGYYITINLSGCTLAKDYETLQVGLPASEQSIYPTEYFSSRIMLDKHITRYDINRQIAPKPVNIKDLRLDMCGTLVSINGLRLSTQEHSGGWGVNENGTWRGYNFFTNKAEETIAVYTSEYADFADSEVPTQEVVINGILQFGKADGKDMFMIKLIDEDDCIPQK